VCKATTIGYRFYKTIEKIEGKIKASRYKKKTLAVEQGLLTQTNKHKNYL
jgi:hypothetical protein